MARQADGSIVIDTRIDQAGLKKGISGISTSLKGITKLVAAERRRYRFWREFCYYR